MNKNLKVVGLGFLSLISLFLFITIILTNKSNNAYAKNLHEVNKVTFELGKSLDELAQNKEPLSYSSNPYVIAENNIAYKKLTNLGISAVVPLYNKLNSSKENGLNEYLYAMAIEEIMNQKYSYDFASKMSVDDVKKFESSGYKLKDLIYGWANGKEFVEAFKNYMHNVPLKYTSIKEDNTLTNNEKLENIVNLGLGVIPYLIEDIESSNYKNIDLEEVLITLLKEKKQVDDSYKKSNINTWINENSENYELLKTIK